MHGMPRRTGPRAGGFTLVELLVVIAIIGLISAAALPVILPALNERRVSEAARILQANLLGIRDAAIRANAPRGLRFLPDPIFSFTNNVTQGGPLASNRFVPIEPAPDYGECVVSVPQLIFPNTVSLSAPTGIADPTYPPIFVGSGTPAVSVTYLRVAEVGPYPYPNSNLTTQLPLNSPTGWKFNIRQGDKIRFNDSGAYYNVAGPINRLPAAANPERFICYVAGETSGGATPTTTTWLPEYLDLTNGIDDDGDGWIDEACDGIDNDGDGIIDPGFNGIDDNNNGTIDEVAELLIGVIPGSNPPASSQFSGTEYEHEVFLGVQAGSPPTNASYTISRRPVVSPNSAETTLPGGVVIDLTTWNAAASISSSGNTVTPTLPERSRLPVDPYSGYIDILLDQTGRVVGPGSGSASVSAQSSPLNSLPFYHFWLTDREGVVAPLWLSSPGVTSYAVPYANPGYGSTATSTNYLLPMPQGTADYPGPNYLKGERRLVTLFAKTGQITSSSIENNSATDQKFNVHNPSQPYYEAQSGIKEQQ